MKLTQYEKCAILRGLTEIKAGKIGQAINQKINIEQLICKIQKITAEDRG